MKWTPDEELFLIENYHNMSVSKLGALLGRGEKEVRHKSDRLGLRKGNPILREKKLPPHERDFIKKWTGKISVREIAEKLNMHQEKVRYWQEKFKLLKGK